MFAVCAPGGSLSGDHWGPADLWLCGHEGLPECPGQGSQAQQHSLGQLPAHVRACCGGPCIRSCQSPENQHPIQAHTGEVTCTTCGTTRLQTADLDDSA